jgi:hypothetical protein
MNSSKIKTWEGGKKESLFVRLGNLGIDLKEQIKNELEGLMTAPKLRSHRFLDARMSLKRTTDKKGVVTTAKNSTPISKSDTTPTTEKNLYPPLSKTNTVLHDDKPAHLGGKSTASIERMMLLPSASLSWGETAGSVLVRIGSRSEQEVDRNKLACAIKAMKATLNGCILQEVKTEDLSCASTQQSTVPNLLKRPATLEGVSLTKRARVAKEDSTQDSTQDSTGEKTVEEEKTVLLPMSTVIKEVYPACVKVL